MKPKILTKEEAENYAGVGKNNSNGGMGNLKEIIELLKEAKGFMALMPQKQTPPANATIQGETSSIANKVEYVEKIIYKFPEIKIKSKEAKEHLLKMLNSLNQDRSIKDYLEKDIKQLDEMGMLEGAMEEFIKQYLIIGEAQK